MEIKFTGTGSGRTSLKRFHSSFIIASGNYNLLVDAGDGISKAILSLGISFSSIDGILISHLHPDHFSGLSALVMQMKLGARKNNLSIFVHESIIDYIKSFIIHSYIFKERLGFDIRFIPFKDNELQNLCEGFNFLPRQNTHLDKYKANVHPDSLSFSCSSFIFSFKDKSIQYTGDIGSAGDILLFQEFNILTLISEMSHASIREIIEIAASLNIKKLVLTHIPDEAEEVSKQIKDLKPKKNDFEIEFAYDGFTMTI